MGKRCLFLLPSIFAENDVFYGLLFQCSSEKLIHLNSKTSSLGLPFKIRNLSTVANQVSAVHTNSNAPVAANLVSTQFLLKWLVQCFTILPEALQEHVRSMCSVKLLKSYKSSLLQVFKRKEILGQCTVVSVTVSFEMVLILQVLILEKSLVFLIPVLIWNVSFMGTVNYSILNSNTK